MLKTILVTVGKRSYVAQRRIGSDNHYGAIAEVLSPGYGRSIAAGVEIALSAEGHVVAAPIAEKPAKKGSAK